MYGFLWDYYAAHDGVEVRLFRVIPIYRLRRKNIVAVHVIDGIFNFKAVFKLGGHPWNTVSLGNRLPRRWILLEKRKWPRFLGITPKDPDAFIRGLGLSL